MDVRMNGSSSIYDVIEGMALTGRERVGGSPAPAAAQDVVLPDYLESGRKHCEKEEPNEIELEWKEEKEEEKYEVVPCGCRSRFCKHCCVGLGLSLRERLLPVLETFTGLLMWTFTIDPKLFASPVEAFEYARENRCISNVMRELRRRGFLHSGRYICVVEWQMGKGEEEGTLMAHYHVLADSSFIPFETVCELWNRFRPEEAGPVEGDRPGFGSVRFSAPKFKNAKHAASYACKYLIKYPEKGYPQWVIDSHDIHRFSTSRGFWGNTAAEPAEVSDEEESTTERPRRTIGEQLAECGKKSVLVKVVECIDPMTGELSERREFVWRLTATVQAVAQRLRMTVADGSKRLPGLDRSCLAMLDVFRERDR